MLIDLIHTTNTEIKEIYNHDYFGAYLFFGCDDCGHGTLSYKVEIDTDEIIEAAQLFYHEDSEKLNSFVSNLAEIYDLDEQVVRDLLDETILAQDVLNDEDGEISWKFQGYTAKAAKLLGYDAVAVNDEHGTSYMLDMNVYFDKLEQI